MFKPLISSASIASYALASRAAAKGVPAWDSNAFGRLNGLDDRLEFVVWGPMQLGALAAPLVTGGIVAFRGNRAVGARIALAGGAAWIAAKAGKEAVGRGRPSDFEPDVKLRFGAADDGLGFPSGHAAVAVALAIGLFPLANGLPTRTALVALPGVVGIARVYVGAHYPLDVVGGWLLGITTALTGSQLLDLAASARKEQR
ncbi:MAG: phosphatase PAP2 family protein [Acidimicrobiia bacterium]